MNDTPHVRVGEAMTAIGQALDEVPGLSLGEATLALFTMAIEAMKQEGLSETAGLLLALNVRSMVYDRKEVANG